MFLVFVLFLILITRKSFPLAELSRLVYFFLPVVFKDNYKNRMESSRC